VLSALRREGKTITGVGNVWCSSKLNLFSCVPLLPLSTITVMGTWYHQRASFLTGKAKGWVLEVFFARLRPVRRGTSADSSFSSPFTENHPIRPILF